MRWYETFRRDLPWRRTRDPYAIWVSEIMLQQTRVDTVVPYYGRFLARFPDPKSLAEAPVDDVLALWSGLGYYRRARLLHTGAKTVAELGRVPDTRARLLDVPGIGRYTAGAIASIAFGEAVGLVDGNVARVLARIFAIDDDMRRAGAKKAEALADAIVHRQDPGGWNQALMELGATVCAPRAPACDRCPVAASCRARAEDRVGELPVLAAKAKPRPVRVQALVATREGRVLLARRRADGLFGGLWEPPSVDGASSAKKGLFGLFPLGTTRSAGKVVHVLSHRRLTIDVHVAELAGPLPKGVALDGYDDVRLVAYPAALASLGISTLATKILACAFGKTGRGRPGMSDSPRMSD